MDPHHPADRNTIVGCQPAEIHAGGSSGSIPGNFIKTRFQVIVDEFTNAGPGRTVNDKGNFSAFFQGKPDHGT
jgi:hypothetical protein